MGRVGEYSAMTENDKPSVHNQQPESTHQPTPLQPWFQDPEPQLQEDPGQQQIYIQPHIYIQPQIQVPQYVQPPLASGYQQYQPPPPVVMCPPQPVYSQCRREWQLDYLIVWMILKMEERKV